MKRLFTFIISSVLFFSFAVQAFAVHVNGYYRSNGTYVAPYERTAPDGIPYNNYSYPGNYNPNTGDITGGNPNTYLDNYNNSNTGGSGYYSLPTYTPPVTLDERCKNAFGQNSQAYGSSQCNCQIGFQWNSANTSCVSLEQVCKEQFGSYALPYGTTQCTCPAGYGWSTSGVNKTCVLNIIQPAIQGAATFRFSRNLKLGMKGDDVQALQNILTDKGFMDWLINTKIGTFDLTTKQGLIKYQKSVGIKATGILDATTITSLN